MKQTKNKRVVKNPAVYLVNGKEYELVTLGKIGNTDQIALILSPRLESGKKGRKNTAT